MTTWCPHAARLCFQRAWAIWTGPLWHPRCNHNYKSTVKGKNLYLPAIGTQTWIWWDCPCRWCCWRKWRSCLPPRVWWCCRTCTNRTAVSWLSTPSDKSESMSDIPTCIASFLVRRCSNRRPNLSRGHYQTIAALIQTLPSSIPESRRQCECRPIEHLDMDAMNTYTGVRMVWKLIFFIKQLLNWLLHESVVALSLKYIFATMTSLFKLARLDARID